MQKKFKNIFQKSVDFYLCLMYYNTCKEERDKKANKKTYKKLKKFLTNFFTNDIINT